MGLANDLERTKFFCLGFQYCLIDLGLRRYRVLLYKILNLLFSLFSKIGKSHENTAPVKGRGIRDRCVQQLRIAINSSIEKGMLVEVRYIDVIETAGVFKIGLVANHRDGCILPYSVR